MSKQTKSNDKVTLCTKCNCMTHTVDGKCGKCNTVETPVNDVVGDVEAITGVAYLKTTLGTIREKSCGCPEIVDWYDKRARTNFDRHDLEKSEKMLGRLRGIGRRRRWNFDGGKYDSGHPNRYHGVRSTAFTELHAARGFSDKNQGIFWDAGCGESADADIALVTGYSKSYATDLFPPLNPYTKFKAEFMLGDICEKTPIRKSSVDAVCSNWVTPLMCQADRVLFYKEVWRVLKPGGYFSVAGDMMSSSHPEETPTRQTTYFQIVKEKERLEGLGFVVLAKTTNCVVAQKLAHAQLKSEKGK